MSQSELAKLNLRQLHRLATYIGAPCSGIKPSRILGVQYAVQQTCQFEELPARSKLRTQPLSIVSIDMGIRNLAYCHLRGSLSKPDQGTEPVRVDAWTRLSIEEPSSSPGEGDQNVSKITRKTPSPKIRATKESYEPAIYAARAHAFVKQIVDSHQPTHVLIERQRFRSGGSSAVQEWSIRVGIFEAMLYAAFHTLKAENLYCCQIISILPKRVNRYWLESGSEDVDEEVPVKKTSSAVKLEKIECVQTMLADQESTNITFSGDAEATKSAFLSRNGRHKSSASPAKLKLDDLSDSFLQGLGWIHWQNNALRLAALGPSAFELGS